MGLFKDVGKNAGSSAVGEAHEMVDGALDTLTNKTMPKAGEIAQHLEEYATFGIAGIIGDIFARLNGAAVPVDITIHISGKIGDLKFTVPANETWSETPSVEVKG